MSFPDRSAAARSPKLATGKAAPTQAPWSVADSRSIPILASSRRAAPPRAAPRRPAPPRAAPRRVGRTQSDMAAYW
jgi:hypothetical protein